MTMPLSWKHCRAESSSTPRGPDCCSQGAASAWGCRVMAPNPRTGKRSRKRWQQPPRPRCPCLSPIQTSCGRTARTVRCLDSSRDDMCSSVGLRHTSSASLTRLCTRQPSKRCSRTLLPRRPLRSPRFAWLVTQCGTMSRVQATSAWMSSCFAPASTARRSACSRRLQLQLVQILHVWKLFSVLCLQMSVPPLSPQPFLGSSVSTPSFPFANTCVSCTAF
mmetsp:Transcript_22511/g.52382  ORF Transcript_22511/g.52382 Transcript_22511/m.52382 type:complete len:220 (-) Transcript_22511:92-751(-)